MFIEQIQPDTLTFKIKQHYIGSTPFGVSTHNAAAKILLALQLTEEFLTLLARSHVSANYFSPPGLRINEVRLYILYLPTPLFDKHIM